MSDTEDQWRLHEQRKIERELARLGVVLHFRDDGSFARAELPEAAIRALSADRGEAAGRAGDGDAVAWRTETPYGVGYLFADELIEAGVCIEGRPPSPAESTEGELYREDEGREPCGDGCCGGCRFIAVESAAPSGVSAPKTAWNAPHKWQDDEREAWAAGYNAALAIQPQPGRVGGMDADAWLDSIDAEKYRWLRDWSNSDLAVRRRDRFPQSGTTQFTLLSGAQLDAAIAAAMKAAPTASSQEPDHG